CARWVSVAGRGPCLGPLSGRPRPSEFVARRPGKPLLGETLARLARLAPPARTYVVCGPVHARGVRRLLPRLPAANVLVEPVARNTAPAIGLATLEIQARDPDGILAVLPSDHHVADVPGVRRGVRHAARGARAAPPGTLGRP